MKIQPGKPALHLSGLDLHRPHLGKSLPRIGTPRAAFGVARGQEQGVQNRFDAARFARFGHAVLLIGIKGIDFVPQVHPLGHVVEHRQFGRAALRARQAAAQAGAGQHMRQRGVARNAHGIMIALRLGPVPPPVEPCVEIARGARGIPRRRVFRRGLGAHQCGRGKQRGCTDQQGAAQVDKRAMTAGHGAQSSVSAPPRKGANGVRLRPFRGCARHRAV